MREYFTEAIVLGVKPQGEYDRIADLYTKELGRVEARVVAGRRITSKLSPYFDIGNKVIARLVYKNQFTVVDVLTVAGRGRRVGGAKFNLRALSLFVLLRSFTPFSVPDLNVWHRLSESLVAGRINFSMFLKMGGYDPCLAACDGCGSKKVSVFMTTTHVFVCAPCLSRYKDCEFVMLDNQLS